VFREFLSTVKIVVWAIQSKSLNPPKGTDESEAAEKAAWEAD
jgi:hypothetical protein